MVTEEYIEVIIFEWRRQEFKMGIMKESYLVINEKNSTPNKMSDSRTVAEYMKKNGEIELIEREDFFSEMYLTNEGVVLKVMYDGARGGVEGRVSKFTIFRRDNQEPPISLAEKLAGTKIIPDVLKADLDLIKNVWGRLRE